MLKNRYTKYFLNKCRNKKCKISSDMNSIYIIDNAHDKRLYYRCEFECAKYIIEFDFAICSMVNVLYSEHILQECLLLLTIVNGFITISRGGRD